MVIVPTLKMENEAQRSSVCSAETWSWKEVQTRCEPGQYLQKKDPRWLLHESATSNGHKEHFN